MFYELRQYTIRTGKMNEWVEFMEGEIIPFQVGKGMVITGSFRGEEDDSVYVWTRRFDSEAQREQLYKDVYESDEWTKQQPEIHLQGFYESRLEGIRLGWFPDWFHHSKPEVANAVKNMFPVLREAGATLHCLLYTSDAADE